MKKIIAVVIVIALIAIAGFYYLYSNLDRLVESAIEKYGSRATQTPVEVAGVSIRLAEGAASISGLTIANPVGFSTPYAFTMEDIATRIDFKNSTRDKIVIDEVLINASDVVYEINDERKTNLLELKNNIAGEPTKPEPEARPAEQPNLVIRRLVFTGGEVHANIGPLDRQYELALPAIEMANLGGESGAPPAEITRQILNRLLDRVYSEVKAGGVGKELEEARQRVEEEKEELKSRAEDVLESRKEEARDKLKDLLK